MACRDGVQASEFIIMSALNGQAGCVALSSEQPSLLPFRSTVAAPPPLMFEPVASGSSPEAPPPKASDRESRIRAEKQRRSQYNLLIGELMSLLPAGVRLQRKIDKTSVLRLAANELRNAHVFGDSVKCSHLERWSTMPRFLELLGGFLLAVTCRGRVLNVSPNVQAELGHLRNDLLGQNLFEFVHPDDVEPLRCHICPAGLQAGGELDPALLRHHEFPVRLARAGARSEPPRYERCRVDGSLRRADRASAGGLQEERVVRRQRVRTIKTFSSSGNDYVFIGMVRVESQAMPARLPSPAAYSEYWTRHLIDGRIVQVEQSISLVAGYMTEEVTGTSAFFFMHKEDVRWVICVLRQMYDQSKEFGESYYRLMSRTGDFIYMRTRGFLEIDSATKQVQSFVCINSVIGEDYGRRMLEDMKRKYSVIVNMKEQSAVSGESGEAPVEHPQRLERIVMHLVEPSLCDNPEPLKIVPPSKDNIISAIKNSERVVSETGIKFDCRKRKINNIVYEDSSEIMKRQNNF